MPSWILTLLVLGLSVETALARQYSRTIIGCYFDNTGTVRDLIGLKNFGFRRVGNIGVSQSSSTSQFISLQSGEMTYEVCGSICSAGGFRFMGLQAGWWCHCGNSYGSQGAAPIGDCGSLCSGDGTQKSGNDNRNYVIQLNFTYDRTRFVPGNRTLIDITSAAVLTIRVDRMTECVYLCRTHRTGCQAVVFNQQQGLCRLLEYAAVPDDLKSADSGDFYVWA